ncbi:branched-chain amino acid ABC transporter permease [Sulfitobacter sp. G21635-S1]|uniref:branched-chain amino acid ABC transporter permease n=1 Tax=Sulfitobacter sp. G21635-S1 TaxID=3014043 RepID=UPI0022B0119B|nr:branched-chain amino acid ABC transporter permease [Sulfitobacter sp. G21635-S1]MCZ4255466.1 branched-chain amino acid ABC transporter permease [Sulfitobacter sp. G21635-S1]
MTQTDFRKSILLLAVAVALLALGPVLLGRSEIRYMTDLFVLIAVAQLWNLLAGYLGIVSIGQHAFVGLGAYAFFALTQLLGIHPFLSLALTFPIGCLVALPSFLLLARLRLAYFAIASWVLAEVLMLILGQRPAFGGGTGSSFATATIKMFGAGVSERIANTYWLCLGMLGIVMASMLLLLRSRAGLAIRALRDDEVAAVAAGINPLLTRAVLFSLCGGMLAVIGAIDTLQKLRISPAGSFSLQDWTVMIIFVVVIGGLGTVTGPIVGAIAFVLFRETLSDFGPLYLAAMGVLAVGVMLLEPRGLVVILTRTVKSIRARH